MFPRAVEFEKKIRTSETHNLFFFSHHFLSQCLKVHVNTQKLSFASLFSFGMFLKLIYLLLYYLRERAWAAETHWLIYKYHLVTPVTSTGRLSHSACSTSTSNAFPKPGLLVLAVLILLLLHQAYALPLPSGALLPLLKDFPRYAGMKK